MKILLAVLAVVGVIALGATWFLGDPSPRLEGEITEIRTLEVDPGKASVLLVNFRAVNTTDLPFIAHERWVEIVDPQGDVHQGTTINTVDVKDLFNYFRTELGGMKDEPFGAQTQIPAGETARGLLVARFEMPEEELKNYSEVVIRVVDGVRRESQIRSGGQ